MPEIVPSLAFFLLLGSLFGFASIEQWRHRLPRQFAELCVTVLGAVDLGLAFGLAHYFADSSFELIATSLAWSHFALVCCWCAMGRGFPLSRVLLSSLILLTLLAIFSGRLDMLEDSRLTERLRYRLLISCVAGWWLGALCRILGWRLSLCEQASQNPVVPARQTWFCAGGLGLMSLVMVGVSWLASTWWTDTFARDFSVAAISCLYAALMLAGTAATRGRGSPFRLDAVVVGLSVLWAVYKIENHGMDSFETISRSPSQWLQYGPWLVLSSGWWWLITKHLSVTSQLVQDRAPLWQRVHLRHVMAAMVLVSFTLASIKMRYVDRLDDHVRREVRAVAGGAQPSQGAIYRIDFADRFPDRIIAQLSRLQDLSTVQFAGTKLEADSFRSVLQAPGLRELSFFDCDLRQLPLDELASIPKLDTLRLVKTRLPGGAAAALGRLTSLQHLTLSEPTLLAAFSPEMPLRELDLSHAAGVEDAAILRLPTAELQRIHFPRHAGWKRVPPPSQLPVLRTLSLQQSTLTPRDVAQINRFANLEVLEIYECTTGIEHLQHCRVPSLQLHDCRVSDADLASLSAIPEEQHFSFRGTASRTEMATQWPRWLALWRAYPQAQIRLEEADSAAWAEGEQLAFDLSGEWRYLTNLQLPYDALWPLLERGRMEAHNVLVAEETVQRDRWPRFDGLIARGLAAQHVDEIPLLKDVPELCLWDPELTDAQWEALAGRDRLQVIWTTRPKEIEQILATFSPHECTLSIRLPVGEVTRAEADAWRAQLQSRLTVLGFHDRDAARREPAAPLGVR